MRLLWSAIGILAIVLAFAGTVLPAPQPDRLRA